MTTQNRVWIELEYPKIKGKTGTDHALGHKRAELADKMLARLGAFAEFKGKRVFWHEDKCMYCFTIDGAGGFTMAQDGGHWYNLDYLGRDE